mmetsp:Transcript_5696/g.17259  ORF Transcript_5696/g.17259 Transcript_5696/m.17259 type:complete len:86 (+) Transcript_5696:178-435(+)
MFLVIFLEVFKQQLMFNLNKIRFQLNLIGVEMEHNNNLFHQIFHHHQIELNKLQLHQKLKHLQNHKRKNILQMKLHNITKKVIVG